MSDHTPAPASTIAGDGARRWRTRTDAGLWSTYRPFFAGRRVALATMSGASFVTGMAESALLVMVANLALAIGGDAAGQSLSTQLGPLDPGTLSVPASFAVALGLAVVRVVSQVVSARIAARISAQLTAEIRSATFHDYAASSWEEQSRRKEADVQDLLTRHVKRATGGVSVIARGLSTSCVVLALVVSAFVVDPLAAFFLVLAGGLLAGVIRPITARAKALSRMEIRAGKEYGARSLEALSLSQEIRSFGVEGQVSERLKTVTHEEAEAGRRSLVLRDLVTATYQLATIVLLLGALSIVHAFVDRPLASLGAIVVILVRALNQTATLQAYHHQLVEAAPFLESLDRERAVLRANVPMSGSRVVGPPAVLRFEGVGYSYDGVYAALTDVAFDIERGEAVGIIGPSGSGKSTLIQLLLRLRQPTTGRYLLDDVDAAEIDDDTWFRQIAFVPQDSHLIDDTVAANIAFYRDVSQLEIEAAARRAHVHDEIVAMPDGYETRLGSRGGALSGGQRQRVSIARALVREPSILVLDEPTSALDMRSEALVHETFAALKGRVTLIVIAHRLSTLNTCDRIMVMGDGSLQAFGPRLQLESASAFYRDALSLSQIRTDDRSDRS